MSDPLPQRPVDMLLAGLAAKEFSARELAQACLQATEARNGELHAFLHLDAADILAQADASDARRASGQVGTLEGIPVAVKDNICVRGQPCTCASRILERFTSPYDATCIEKLRQAGAVLFGRANLDEFAMGSSTENSAFGLTRNPHDPRRVAGGSSGGSAAAVSAGMVPLALGSDTGGSIRQPAAFCGVVGIKPTYGRVSRYGLVAFASSLDQIGPFAHTINDAARLLGVISGPDPHDSTSYPEPSTLNAETLAPADPASLTVGLPREYFDLDGLDAQVRAQVEAAVEALRRRGCRIVEVSLPHREILVPVYYLLATAEASSNLARFDGVRYTSRSERATDAIDLYSKTRGEFFGEEVKRRIILGTFALSSGYHDAYYTRAQQARTLVRRGFEEAFLQCDVLLSPTTPNPAFEAGAIADPLQLYLQDIFTIGANLAGIPALSLPCGKTPQGLPVGLQLLGPALAEERLLRAARTVEETCQAL